MLIPNNKKITFLEKNIQDRKRLERVKMFYWSATVHNRYEWKTSGHILYSPSFLLIAKRNKGKKNKKIYMACWILKYKTGSPMKRINKLRWVKSIQRVELLLCAPCVSPIRWTSTASGDWSGRRASPSPDPRPDLRSQLPPTHACEQTRVKTEEKAHAVPGRVIVAPGLPPSS